MSTPFSWRAAFPRWDSDLPTGLPWLFNPPATRGLGTTGGFEAYVQARDDVDPLKLGAVTQAFTGALAKHPLLQGVNTFYRSNVPQLLMRCPPYPKYVPSLRQST